MVICQERGVDLHMAQLMPLPLTVSCFSDIQIGFTFYQLTRVVPEKGPLNGCVCVYFLPLDASMIVAMTLCQCLSVCVCHKSEFY